MNTVVLHAERERSIILEEDKNDVTIKELVKQSNEILDLFGEMQLFNAKNTVSNFKASDFPEDRLKPGDMCFYKIDQLMYDEDYPRREAFENVISALDNQSFNFVYILEGDTDGVDMYIGIVGNSLNKKDNMSAARCGDLLKRVFEGNFSGSMLTKLKTNLKEKERDAIPLKDDLLDVVFHSTDKYTSVGTVVGIPSILEEGKSDEYDFQGIDRLINSMLGLEWRMVVVCEPMNKTEILEVKDNIYEMYNRLSACSKYTMQVTKNIGDSYSAGVSNSDSKGSSHGFSFNKSQGSTNSNHDGTRSKNTQTSNDRHKDFNESHQDGRNFGYTQNRGQSNAVTVEIANKRIQDMMKYIDEDLLERLKRGYGKGLFRTSTYYMATNPDDANRLKVNIMSLFQGSESTFSPLIAKGFTGVNEKDKNKILHTYQNHYEIDQSIYSTDIPLLNSRPYYGNGKIGLGTFLTTKEISLLAGMPQKEVPGIGLKENVSFGLNLKKTESKDEDKIVLGSILHKGRILENSSFSLDSKLMSKHVFIAGVTGSGKTTTCQKLLSNTKIPFMVIEPAKTEYRALIKKGKYKDLIVLTLGNDTLAPFRLNPFELLPGEIISAHIDMIKATFTSAFPMEASMPQILEEAIYKCYEKKGWNFDTNENDIYKEKAYSQEVNSFPILSDLLNVISDIVETKKFGGDLKANYIGSLVSRLSNLTIGAKGSMLNCMHSMDFHYLVKHNVIIEMEEMKSPEDKSLLMGFILAKVTAIIKAEHKRNKHFQHLTLIEEAHRLLAKPEFSDSGSKKMAVETFTDLLAEIRKYGEGLIIVDQIPNKLAPEVLKNTNTKIIHKILARDDKEAVGDTMLMDDKQKEYLSALGTGEAIVFNENTEKPVHIKVKNISNTNEDEVEEYKIRERFLEKAEELGSVFTYLEVEKHYKRFEKLIADANFTCRECDKDKCNAIKDFIQTVSKEAKLDELKVWEILIKRRDVYSGKCISDVGTEGIRYKKLSEFYLNVLCQEDITGDSISDYNKLF